MTRSPRRWQLAAMIVGVMIAAAGCAGVSEVAQDSSLDALATRAPAPLDFAAPPNKKPVSCDRLFSSLRPSTLPPPGRMPPGSFMQRIHRRGKLHVGVDQNTLRLGYYDPAQRKLEGFDIELARQVAKAIFGTVKERILFKAISTAQRESAISLEDVDLVASAFSITCKRLQHLYFSSVYYIAQQKLLVPKDSAVRRLADLRGRKVCATKSSTSIENLLGTGVVPHPVELRPDCLVELQEGKVAAITADDSILFGFKLQDPQTKIVGGCINVERYGLAVNRRHPEFVRFVNGVLKRLGKDGLARLRHRWLRRLPAPRRGDISRCDRAAARRAAAREATQARRARRAMSSHQQWCAQMIAPEAPAIIGCAGRATRPGRR